jgi:hypothetical protein
MESLHQSSIKRISIINVDTGIEIYQKNYEPSFFLEHDNQLISGLLSALIQFSREIVKDDLQEIVFPNSTLFMKKFHVVLIVLMTPLGVDFKDITQIIDYLGEQVEKEFETSQLDFVTPQIAHKIEKLIDSILEYDIEFPEITVKTKLSPKMVIAGLRKAGKTTAIRYFFESWDREKLESITPTVDYSIINSFIDVLKSELTIFDLGGQIHYIDQHLKDESKWRNATAVIFMVDLQKPEEYNEAYSYLMEIMKIYEKLDAKPFIGLLAHKYDPDKVGELQINLLNLMKTFKGLFEWPRYSVFLSSIQDNSLYLAFMRTLARIIPRDLLKEILSSAIFFETQNEVWKTISETISPDTNPQAFWDKILTLSTPYGENLANKIFQDWLTGDTTTITSKPSLDLVDVKIGDILGGMHVNVNMPKEGNTFLILAVVEGLLTGLGNVFGFSRVIRLVESQSPTTLSSSWGLYEF